MNGERLGLLYSDFGQIVLFDVGASFETSEPDEPTFWSAPEEAGQGHSLRWNGRAVSISAGPPGDVDLRVQADPLPDGAASFELSLQHGPLGFAEILNFPEQPDFTLPLAPGQYRVSYLVEEGPLADPPEEADEDGLTLHLQFVRLG